jgi:hypothetical protein
MSEPEAPVPGMGPAGFTRDLVRWSETLAAIARTGLGFTESLYERERFEEVLHVAADIKAAANEAMAVEDLEAIEAQREQAHFVQEWLESVGVGVPGYVTPRSPSGPSSATTTASCCWCSGPTRRSGCTRPAGPTSATRRPRSP